MTIGHVLLCVLLCWQRCSQPKRAVRDHGDGSGGGVRLRRIVQTYAAVLVAIGFALPAQLLEYPRCPRWLYESGYSVHAIWHLGIFFAVYHLNMLLRLLEVPPHCHVVWASPLRCAPWLFFRPATAAAGLATGFFWIAERFAMSTSARDRVSVHYPLGESRQIVHTWQDRV